MVLGNYCSPSKRSSHPQPYGVVDSSHDKDTSVTDASITRDTINTVESSLKCQKMRAIHQVTETDEAMAPAVHSWLPSRTIRLSASVGFILLCGWWNVLTTRQSLIGLQKYLYSWDSPSTVTSSNATTALPASPQDQLHYDDENKLPGVNVHDSNNSHHYNKSMDIDHNVSYPAVKQGEYNSNTYHDGVTDASSLLIIDLFPLNTNGSSYVSSTSSTNRKQHHEYQQANNNSLYFQNCSPTAGVKLLILRNSSLSKVSSITKNNDIHEFSQHGIDSLSTGEPWILETYYKDGSKKHVGGDEIYVTYTDNNQISTSNQSQEEPAPTAVAFVKDLDNGTYILTFKTTPMDPRPSNLSGKGTLWVYINFTCGTALAPVPLIINAEEAGFIPIVAKKENVLQPPIHVFSQPKLDDMSKYKKVIFHGDSMIRMMITSSGESIPLQRKIYFQSNVLFRKNVRCYLSNDTADYFMHQFNKNFMVVKQNYPQVAVILGSAVWDLAPVKDKVTGRYAEGVLVQGAAFEDHILACRRLIELFRKAYGGLKLIWRLPSAMHPHRQGCSNADKGMQACLERVTYVSTSRSEYLYRKQKELMDDMNMTYWDFFEATYLSAHYTLPGDVMHYTEEFNRFILDWLYPGQHSGNFTHEGKPVDGGT